MKPRDDPAHDRAFKIRPVTNHFNNSFLSAMEATQFESIDKHMTKFKRHNIMSKGNPFNGDLKCSVIVTPIPDIYLNLIFPQEKKVAIYEFGLR